jgi:predicted pyridoxine 5'-phosphate oxidase superfamily flavin-nucleotide-binding protein
MHRLNELAAKLTPAEVRDLERYAESLAARHASDSQAKGCARPNRIRLDELDGLLTRMTDDTPWSEAKKRLRNDWADAAED